MVMSTEKRREQLREAARRHRAKKKLQRAMGHPPATSKSASEQETIPIKKVSAIPPPVSPKCPKLTSPCNDLVFPFPTARETTLIHSLTEKRRLKSREASRRHREKLKAARSNPSKSITASAPDSNGLTLIQRTDSAEAPPALAAESVSGFPPILPVGMAVPPQVFPQLSKTEKRRIQSRISSKKFRERNIAGGASEKSQATEAEKQVDGKIDKVSVNSGIALGAIEAELVANLLSLRN